MMTLVLVVGIVLTGMNGFMVGRLWEKEKGIYRQRYEFLSEMISDWAKMIELREKLDKRSPFISPVQVNDL